MERNEISIQEAFIYDALRSLPGQWLTNSEIKAAAGKVSPRTVRLHTLRMVQMGILEQAEVFPAHRYRWSDMDIKRNPAYARRLDAACEVFGIILPPRGKRRLTRLSPEWASFQSEMEKLKPKACKHDFAHATRVLEQFKTLDIPSSLAFLQGEGAACDCEVALNVLRAA